MSTVKASCVLVGAKVKGSLVFEQSVIGGPTTVKGQITGLETGKHGFHIHQYGDLSNGCTSCAGHYNPFGKNHGGPSDAERHAGDLGNIEAKAGEPTTVDITDTLLSLVGAHSVVGRAVVVHAGEDDLGKGGHDDSLTTGHAGAREACGVIGLCASA